MAAERYLFCQYCDDVRREADGKLIYIGVYQGGMRINAPLPATLPTFRIVCNAWTPVERPFRRVSVRVTLAGKELLASDVPQDLVENMIALTEAKRDAKHPGALLNLTLAMQNVEIAAPGRLDVVLTTEEGELRGNGLDIEAADLSPPTAGR